MTAYDILKEGKLADPVDELRFNQLIKDFIKSYLETENYYERLGKHRNPVEVKNEEIQKLYAYDMDIQNRPEMRDIEEKSAGYVPARIKEILMADKGMKSLYAAVKHYCQLRKKDFNTIAVHIAEYRAVLKLTAIVKRDKKNIVKTYTFKDWLNNKFYNEQDYSGSYVANDSENYLVLVAMGKMTYDELNKIQDAQQKAYDYMIEYSLRLNERQFQRQTKDTLDLQQVIDIKLEETRKYLKENIQIHKEVLLPRLHRSIKIGAKFLLPEHYLNCIDKKLSDVYTPGVSVYSMWVNKKMTSYPTPEQMKYAITEVKIRWIRYLSGYKMKIKFDEMVGSKDFKTLIENYGEGEKLMDSYLEGLNFAPDREVYINTRIRNYESVLPKYQAVIGAWDKHFRREIKIQVGEYKRIGFAWVNNGHNAQQSDLQTSTLNNVTLCPEVPHEDRYGIYIQVLYHLATGGAMAFHLAFLRKELKRKEDVVKKITKPVIQNSWQGTEKQRIKLFEELASMSFVTDSKSNRTKFMNNKVILWKQDGRSLFYMLEQLKQKYKMIERFSNLGPIVRDNFTNKEGEPFKNISQSLNGMVKSNKNSKPRLASAIDEILQKL